MERTLAGEGVDVARRRAPVDESPVPVGRPETAPATAHRMWAPIAAAAIPALLYLAFVSHYALDVPLSDDWNLIALAAHARHHHVAMVELWSQYADTRLFVGRIVFAGFGLLDHLNLRHIILFSAITYIASFAILLVLFRAYLRRRLTFLPVLSLAVVWFSVADFQNALWSFQLAWYLVVFFFVAMAYFLVARDRYRNLFFALGIVCAVLASLTEVQGFGVWAVGLVCLLWAHPRVRRTSYECAIWISAAVLVTAIYLHNFNFGYAGNICQTEGGSKGSCSLAYGALHPVPLARFLAVLAGNVVPTRPGSYVGVHELLGAAIWIAAALVVFQSVRDRRLGTGPLPVLLILFALEFDLMLALSRLGQGPAGAGKTWYTMPNIILLSGIVIFAWRYVPDRQKTRERIHRGRRLTTVGLTTLAAFLLLQAVVATQFGITNGRELRASTVTVGRVLAHFSEIPVTKRECYVVAATDRPSASAIFADIDAARFEQLALFQSGRESQFRSPPRDCILRHPRRRRRSIASHVRLPMGLSRSGCRVGPS